MEAIPARDGNLTNMLLCEEGNIDLWNKAFSFSCCMITVQKHLAVSSAVSYSIAYIGVILYVFMLFPDLKFLTKSKLKYILIKQIK